MNSLLSIKERLQQVNQTVTCDSKRLFHGRGGTYQGLNHVSIDWFSPAVVITLFDNLEEEAQLIEIVRANINQVESVYVQRRYLPKPVFDLVWGADLVDLVARRKQLAFKLNLHQQNIGYFLDIEPARLWLEERSQNKRVLNLFSFTCSFSVVASKAGATSVLNMDLSSKSLSVGRDNYRMNALPTDSVRFFANDILRSWSKIKKYSPYDIVIVDPPSFQKGSFIASRDYQKILRRLDQLVAEGGQALLCLNAPEVPCRDFLALVEAQLLNFRFVERLEANSDFPDIDSERALKMLVFEKIKGEVLQSGSVD